MTVWFEADDFVVQERTQLSGFQFWNYARTGYFTGLVTWQIYANSSANGPGRLIASGASSNLTHTMTGSSQFDFLFEAITTVQIAPVTLDPGIYWLALHNGPREHVERGMFWAPTERKAGSGAPSHSREAVSNGPWYSNDEHPGMVSELAFQVFGAVVPRVAGTGFVNGAPVVRFTSKVGKQYRLEFRNHFTESWRAVPGREVINGTGAEIQANDPQADAKTARRRFYRIVVL
jgi:hypothetical protein